MSDQETFKIAIVGSGPGGLSAAGRAAEQGVSHILLESEAHISNTIYLYQKGKHVMDEPGILPLRSPFDFTACSREKVLEVWENQLAKLQVNIHLAAEITGIEGQKGKFRLSLKSGDTIQAETVILAIGMQGNLRKLGAEGEDLPFVQYQLDDPEEYEDETIVVIGAGDSAIENAMALSKLNNVIIVNRKGEFSRAKEGNLKLITQAIERGTIECYYNSTVNRVDAFAEPSDEGKAGTLVLNTAEGSADIPVNRIIARLGAIAPRRFVESCGITFPSKDPNAIPTISDAYESNVPGLYIVGALGGNPLIKQAMNQGYEVVEQILGNPVKPADEPLLEKKFAQLSNQYSVSETLAIMQKAVPLLGALTTLQLRELLLDSEILVTKPGDIIYRHNDYSGTFYSIVSGSVKLQAAGQDRDKAESLSQGDFFGEWSLISGRRRLNTVIAGTNTVLVETSRRAILKLISSVPEVEKLINDVSVLRTLQAYLTPGAPAEILKPYADKARVERYQTGATILEQGASDSAFHVIRSGSATLSRTHSGQNVITGYLPVGSYIGEVAVFSNDPSAFAVTATVPTETISLDKQTFKNLMDHVPLVRQRVESAIQERLQEGVDFINHPERGELIRFTTQHGIGEATDVLLIDESLCVHCDNCEKACAETHGGVSRLDREAGPTFASIHIPTSCRHCEHPHCMQDCPPDAIHRGKNGEVYIEDSCIGCGNCEQNCPYDVIHMAKVSEKNTSLFSWLVLGKGTGPGEPVPAEQQNPEQTKKAVKCDMCKGLSGGSSCVRACPTGAAIRVSAEDMVEIVR